MKNTPKKLRFFGDPRVNSFGKKPTLSVFFLIHLLFALKFFKEVLFLQQSKRLVSLKQNHLFGLAYTKGKCYSCRTAAVYILKNRRATAKTMLGITVSKKRGKAVERNRAKRIIREAFRRLYPQVKEGYIIVVVARQSCMDSTSAVVYSQLKEILDGAALLCDVTEKLS